MEHIKEDKKECHDAASALVVSNNHRRELMVLLLDHPKIGKWIPIGGHVERFESVESAVIRELEEEIGVSPIYWFDRGSRTWTTSPVIFEEKMEKIQAFKSNDIHFHRDFIFVAAIDHTAEESFVGEAAGKLKWFTLEQIFALDPSKTTPETLELAREMEKFQKELSM